MNSLPQTTFEQRNPFYEDVETLIETGFLSHSLSIGGIRFVLRSLGPGDLFLLQARTGDSLDQTWQLWTIATSIWMVNGYNILTEDHAPVRMFEVIQKLPRSAREIMFGLISGLFARQNRAISAVEPYCYESVSRFKWKGYNGHAPGSYSGIRGISHLGLNYVQQMWAVFNDVEDRRIHDQSLWDGFKLVASAMAPKGIKKIDQKESQMRQSEEERRRAVRDRFYYISMGVMLPDGQTREGYGEYMTFSKTPDELAQEMYNWVTGKEDHHDKVVNSYKHQVIEKYRSEKAEQETRRELLRKRLDEQRELHEDMDRPIVGYTQQQLANILKDRNLGRPGVRQVFESDRDDRDYLYEKYLESAPDAGLLREKGNSLSMAPGATDFTDTLQDRPVIFRPDSGGE